MRRRRTLAALLAALCLTLSACGAGNPAQTPAPATPADEAGTPAVVLDQARDVAADLEQRQADLESLIP